MLNSQPSISCNSVIFTMAGLFFLTLIGFTLYYFEYTGSQQQSTVLSEQIIQLETVNKDQVERNNVLNTQLKTKQQNITQLESSHQQKLKQLSQQHNEQQQRYESMQNQATITSQHIQSSSDAELQQIKQQNLKLIKITQSKQEAILDQQYTIDLYQQDLTQAKNLFNHQQQQTFKVQQKLIHNQSEVKQRDSEIDEWQKEVLKLKQQLSNTDIQISQLKSRFTVFEMRQEILFNLGQTQLNKEGRKNLSALANILRQYPKRQIAIQGHSDNQALGPTLKKRYNSNWELAAARAASAIYYLQNNESITPERMILVSYAQYRPLQNLQTEHARAVNRRIEIILMPEDFDFFRESTR